MHKWAYLFIAAGAALWGVISIFVQFLYSCGFTALQVVAIRAISSALLLAGYVAWRNRSLLKIAPTDIKYFIGTGLFSIVFFNWCYFTAIKETSVSVAAILLYTAPAFVTILSRILFKEWLTTRKVTALLITFLGCSFVIGLFPSTGDSVSLYGLTIGIGAGFGYALYSIFGKFALKKYHTLTVTTYTFLVAGIGILPVSHLWTSAHLFLDWKVIGYSIGLGLFPTVLAYLLYTYGLSHVESSRASITATVEPIVAACVGIILFGEMLTVWQIFGILLVIAAVASVQKPEQKREPKAFT
ncbi:transporter [Aneurinibacillus migulanus]|uniref:DMT family transporter n=1 Tax=Aneurinibacillus migulanus TaxID=47500 RepID=UPI0005BB932A|nr:EamA family transporter [Aneurinibacillus migulanus]KIV57356.1 transporter [Aneurinibacillus migulanus]KPD09231.1 transporter [Aneurinibacillus migulanus]MCP1358018.1 DMT family transporter [Aneurinibacillus migulanus]